MPVLPPVANVSRVVMNWLYNGQPCANVLHYLNVDGTGGPTAADIAPDIIAAYSGVTIAHIPTTAILQSIIVSPLDAGGSPPVEWSTGLPVPGQSGSPSLPNNVTIATRFTTAFAGRSFRGRAYWIGLVEADVVANTVTAEMVGVINALWETLRILEPAAGEATYQLAVVSYISAGAPRAVPVATPVASVSTNNVVDTQRRRMP